MIVAMRGAPGAGKTTALEEIRQRTACIDVDTVWAMLGGAPWATPGAYDLALEASARLAVTFHARRNGAATCSWLAPSMWSISQGSPGCSWRGSPA